MPHYAFAHEALKDIEEIWVSTSQNWSVDQADRYYSQLINEIEFVSLNPMIGKSIDFVWMGYRSFKVQSHIIFYKIVDTESILIVRVLHQSMDIENRLK